LLDSLEGTCLEIAAYDAAAKRIEGHDTRVKLDDSDDESAEFHALVVVDGQSTDPAGKLQRGAVGGCGCEGGSDG
jgi:hypothetical protein